MLKGTAVSEGIGIGKVYLVKEQEPVYTALEVTDTEAELERFQSAIETFCADTEALAKNMEHSVNQKEAAIIRGHIQMLKDPYMLSQIEEGIRNGACAEASCETVLDTFIQMFSGVEDEFTRQRAADVKDIKRRILSILLNIEEKSLADIPPQSILVTKELTPSMTAQMKKESVCGIVTEKGGTTSHSAILARALEIPAVLSVEHAAEWLRDNDMVIVDGMTGNVLQNPEPQEEAVYRKKQAGFQEEKERLRQYAGRESVTADGLKKEVFCNIGNPKDAVTAAEKDGEGIGLFRTEFLFMDKQAPPSEEEQFEAYKKAAQIFKDSTVIIRTLDIGGDKEIPYLDMEQEDNPFLGFRAVRYCLKNEALYETQLRAIIRASAFGHIRIMTPLVTNVEEIRTVKSKVKRLIREFREKGIACDEHLKVGIMIETPAASLIADLLAKESDFFSIGTNDLTQYIMAADRGNSQVAYLNKAWEPAVLRSIRHIIQCGIDAGIPVGMCGEAAADPKLIPLLLSFGLEEFSVAPSSVLSVRYHIAQWTKRAADELAQTVMSLESAAEIERVLTEHITNRA